MKIYTNPQGFLEQQKCSRNMIMPRLLSLVEDSSTEIINQLGDKVRSIYLYGGLAQGKRCLPYSDLDIMLFFHDELDCVLKNTIFKLQLILTQKHKTDFSYVGLDCATPQLYIREQPLVYGFLTKSLGIHIAGEDIQNSLLDTPLNKEFGKQLNGDFEERITRKYSEFLLAKNTMEKLLGCRWIMKKLLRTSFGLILEKVDFFENDIDGLALILKQFFPEKKEIIEHIHFLVNTPTIDNLEVENILNEYLVWLKIQWGVIYS